MMRDCLRIFVLLPFIACLHLGVYAQDDGYLNHAGIGLQVGTNGIGLELASPVGPSFQARVGYTFVPPFSRTRVVQVPEHPGATGEGKGRDMPVDVKATSQLSDLEILLDYFPLPSSSFRVTAGLMYGPKDVLGVKNTSPLPSDYNTVGLDVDDYTVKAINNYVDGYIGVNSIRPYVGVGLGRAYRSDRRFSFTFDLGALFWGRPGLFAPGEPLIGDWKDVRVDSRSLNGRDDGLVVLAEKITVYPSLNAHVFINLL